jgi:hypothetical protein
MAKRFIIKDMKVNEVSSVDRPAQSGATAVIMKRGELPEMELAKMTFEQTLRGNMLSEQVRDAFYKTFNNLYTGKDAFRKALADEIAAGGDGTKASEAFKQWFGTLVDQALGAAKALDVGQIADLEKTITKAATDWLDSQETDMLIKTRAELEAAINKAKGEGDNVTVGTVTAIHKAAADLKAEDILPAEGPLSKAAKPKVEEDEDMKAMKAKMARMEKRDALSTDLRKHYDTLSDDAARDAFLAKDASAQQTELAKAAGDDPVVYTTLDGIDIRKSAGDAVVNALKSADSARREVAVEKAQRVNLELEKRAETELGKLGGTMIGKKALLKAVDAIEDESLRKAAQEVIASATEIAGKGDIFEKRGSGRAVTLEKGSAESKLEKMAQDRAKDKSISFEKAYTEVLDTEDGQKLYAEMIG